MVKEIKLSKNKLNDKNSSNLKDKIKNSRPSSKEPDKKLHKNLALIKKKTLSKSAQHLLTETNTEPPLNVSSTQNKSKEVEPEKNPRVSRSRSVCSDRNRLNEKKKLMKPVNRPNTRTSINLPPGGDAKPKPFKFGIGKKKDDVTVPQLNEKHVKMFEKRLNHPKKSTDEVVRGATRSNSSSGFMNRKLPEVRRSVPAAKSQEDEEEERMLKPSEIKAKRLAEMRNRGGKIPAPTKSASNQDCEVHKKEVKSFQVIRRKPEQNVSKPSKPDPPVWNRPKISNKKSEKPSSSHVTRNPPTAVVAPLPSQVVESPKKKQIVEELPIDEICDESYDTFIEKDISNLKSTVDFLPPEDCGTFIEKDVSEPNMSFIVSSYTKSEAPVIDQKRNSEKKIKKHKKIARTARKSGHDFKPAELQTWINWCDACGGVIMSVFATHHVTCSKCNMLCHLKCVVNISLTCEADENEPLATENDEQNSLTHSLKTTLQETKDESTLKEYNTIQRKFSKVEIEKKIEEFNENIKGAFHMTLQEDGQTFRGFIRVSMNLQRPVSASENSKTVKQKLSSNKSSFYIEKGATKALHLTSDTTAEKVVEALLNKFKIVDNPKKFALYERFEKEKAHSESIQSK